MGMQGSVCKLPMKNHLLFTIADQISECKKPLKNPPCLGGYFKAFDSSSVEIFYAYKNNKKR